MTDLFSYEPPPERAFGGSTYDAARDYRRLKGRLLRVYLLMIDGQWRTLAEIQSHVGGSEAGISARLRDLRKSEYGGHVIEREHVECGLHRYRLKME